LLLVALGILFALAIVVLARLQLLTLRYTLGWFLVALSIGAAGALTGLAEPLADALDIRPIELLLGLSLALLLLIAVQLSITASGLIQTLRTLNESQALADERIRRLERAAGGESHPTTPSAGESVSS
jgi:hypothetical protein